MSDETTPEMKRLPLWNIVLWIRYYNLADNIHEFLSECVDPPEAAAIDHAINELVYIDGLAADTSLTPLGRCLANIPLEPRLAKYMILCHLFGCGDLALSALATVDAKVSKGQIIFLSSIVAECPFFGSFLWG